MTTKENVEELAQLVEQTRAKLKEAQDYADKHGLILEFDMGHSDHYVPNRPFNELSELSDGLWQIQGIIDYYNEDEPGAGEEEFDHSFRGRWCSSSSYCF